MDHPAPPPRPNPQRRFLAARAACNDTTFFLSSSPAVVAAIVVSGGVQPPSLSSHTLDCPLSNCAPHHCQCPPLHGRCRWCLRAVYLAPPATSPHPLPRPAGVFVSYLVPITSRIGLSVNRRPSLLRKILAPPGPPPTCSTDVDTMETGKDCGVCFDPYSEQLVRPFGAGDSHRRLPPLCRRFSPSPAPVHARRPALPVQKSSKAPILVPCGHTFCRECVVEWCRRNEATKTFPCPSCNRRFELVRRHPLLSQSMPSSTALVACLTPAPALLRARRCRKARRPTLASSTGR